MQALARLSSASASRRVISGVSGAVTRPSYRTWRGKAHAAPLSSQDPPTGRKREFVPKKERKARIEEFIEIYQTSNDGKFPTIQMIRQHVGGGHYTVRDVLQEVKYNQIKFPFDRSKIAQLHETDECADQSKPEEESGNSSLNPQSINGKPDEDDTLPSEKDSATGTVIMNEPWRSLESQDSSHYNGQTEVAKLDLHTADANVREHNSQGDGEDLDQPRKYPRSPMADESWRLPNSVQQLAATGQEPSGRYLLRENEPLGRNLAGAEMPEPIPVIDLGLLSASNDADEAAKLRSALQTWGFFQVSNHGMEDLMDSVMTTSREFFRLPIEEKRKYSNLIDGKHFQIEGYGNDQVKTQDQRLDWSDRLHLKVEPEDERNLAHWPIHPESFRDVLHEYTLKSKRIKDDILRAMAKLLELEEDCLVNQFSDRALTYARFNYYPPCPRPDLVLGIKPHSDVFALTVLLMDKDVAGLQVLRDGTWYSVPAVSNYTLMINVGVTMEIMTNGVFRGPVHRVVTNAEKERMSVAVFYGMDPEKEIGPIADMLNEEQPARYRKMKNKDFLVVHYEYFTRGERVVDALRI